MRSEKQSFPEEFKKAKSPTFDGEMNKSQDPESWLLGMNKLFILHEYLENLKAIIATFSHKGKADIWWEDMKQVRDIKTDDLSWHDFKNKYLLERYYDSKAKESYEIKMGSTTHKEYRTKFLDILRYVPYHTYDKAKVQRLSVVFHYHLDIGLSMMNLG